MSNAIVTDLPIIGPYGKQRFTQFCPADVANWFIRSDELGKKKSSYIPTMGRRHINFSGTNRLIFDSEPRLINQSINYWYAVVGDKIIRTDKFFNQTEITASLKLSTLTGDVFFTYIVISPSVAGSMTGITFVLFSDGQHLYLYREETGDFGIITDPNLPANPWALATFGNRVTVSTLNGATFGLSEINLNYNASFATMLTDCFTIANAAIFAQETGIIRQMGVLLTTLYIFTDYGAGIWSNIPSTFFAEGGSQTSFPWKRNTTYSFDTGISAANAGTLSIEFDMMCWMGQKQKGIDQPMVCTGGKPTPISDKAIDVLIQHQTNIQALDPFLTVKGVGFLYDYESTIFYRFSSGVYTGTGFVDEVSTAASIEYNFDTQTWHRVIEVNGERCRIQQHVYLGDRHLVTVLDDSTVYEMSGRYYDNEITNPAESNPQAADAYLRLPFRYERITNILVAGMIPELKAPGFYAEFKTNYVEIDFMWGNQDFVKYDGPYTNAIYIIDELGNYILSETGEYLISEQGNYPVLDSPTYFNWFKPNIELLFSNDGGVTFQSAGQLEFSSLGTYQWRMRWYQLGCSRNRVYKLICVSPAPISILGASMEVENVSGGAA